MERSSIRVVIVIGVPLNLAYDLGCCFVGTIKDCAGAYCAKDCLAEDPWDAETIIISQREY